jgi:hypothetical protein
MLRTIRYYLDPNFAFRNGRHELAGVPIYLRSRWNQDNKWLGADVRLTWRERRVILWRVCTFWPLRRHIRNRAILRRRAALGLKLGEKTCTVGRIAVSRWRGRATVDVHWTDKSFEVRLTRKQAIELLPEAAKINTPDAQRFVELVGKLA